MRWDDQVFLYRVAGCLTGETDEPGSRLEFLLVNIEPLWFETEHLTERRCIQPMSRDAFKQPPKRAPERCGQCAAGAFGSKRHGGAEQMVTLSIAARIEEARGDLHHLAFLQHFTTIDR